MERRRSSRPALSCLSHSAVRTSLARWQDQFDAPGAGTLCASGGIGSVETAAAAMSFHFSDCFCQVSTATKCPPETFAFGSLNQTVYKFPGTSLLRCHPKYSQRLGFEEPSKNAQGLPSDSEFVHCNNVTQPHRILLILKSGGVFAMHRCPERHSHQPRIIPGLDHGHGRRYHAISS